ncbi:Hypothetical predicted protein [Cloeon dipterum]|uniref:Pre-mRNA-splicing factor ISY1 homolog n=1 Tax=Cloeon dipterum TaxID=197152 RepID=A0A8S1CBH6_9INSE|nr:Hypothetical predicted protein [Cloeon dipterum]
MARNAEKAMTTLARWRASQLDDWKKKTLRRPYLASECTNLRWCEKWRRQVIGEIAKKVTQIQNAGLGEFRIRDLNDEINKLLREKGHWEAQIKELGGPDYARTGPRMLDHEGREVPGNRGYKYFGAAKELPGVKELFEQEPPPPTKKTRGELMREIDADYYGYRDDDDGILIPREQEVERKVIAAEIEGWKSRKEVNSKVEEEEDIYYAQPEDNSDDEATSYPTEGTGELSRFIAHVPVPSQQDIEAAILKRKKQELIEKYASDEMMA